MTHPLDGLDEIAWKALPVAYGDGREVPDILRRLASPNLTEVEGGWDLLSEQILWHQGTVYAGTAEAVPFLARLAARNDTHRRPRIIDYLAQLSLGSDEPYSPAGTAQRVRLAVRECAAHLYHYLDTPDPALGLAMLELASAIPENFGDAARLVGKLRRVMTGMSSAALAAAACLLGDRSPAELALLQEVQEGSIYTARVIPRQGGGRLVMVDQAAGRGATGDGYQAVIRTPVFDEMTRWMALGRPADGAEYIDMLHTVHSLITAESEIMDAIWTAP
jgi:hypothetical protein